MARTNQGVFKAFLNRQKELEKKYDRVMEEYGSDVDRLFFDGLAQNSGDLYDDIDAFLGDLRGMMKSTKFEETGSEKKYFSIIDDMEQKKEVLRYHFNDWVRQIEYGGGLDEYEIKAIDGYRIWNR